MSTRTKHARAAAPVRFAADEFEDFVMNEAQEDGDDK